MISSSSSYVLYAHASTIGNVHVKSMNNSLRAVPSHDYHPFLSLRTLYATNYVDRQIDLI